MTPSPLLLLGVFVLAACRPISSDREVEYFLRHPKERAATLAHCHSVSLWGGPSLRCYDAWKADSLAAHKLISLSAPGDLGAAASGDV